MHLRAIASSALIPIEAVEITTLEERMHMSGFVSHADSSKAYRVGSALVEEWEVVQPFDTSSRTGSGGGR